MTITKETRERIAKTLVGLDTFYLALGQFVAQFSETEALIQTVFWELAGIQSPTAQAVFSGVRTDDAMGKITRIADAQKWSLSAKNKKDFIFGQLKHINKLRNNILHYGAQLEGPDTWKVTNENFVHVPENISSEVISPQILQAARNDLDTIELLLIDLILINGPHEQAARDAIDEALKTSWQYKPPPQAGRRRKNRDRTPKRKHRPAS